ncbi:MAG TPA: YlxR family protein [Eubacteriales bacterium]|nr:YlxR family protein [Eubacteriales bacterium]
MKNIPMRMCLACRQMQPKKDLIRVVKTPDGDIVVDTTGKANGRGAYLCKNDECLAKCEKTKAMARQFETAISKNIYDQLKEIIHSEK